MKIGKSEKKHFCNKYLAGLKDTPQRSLFLLKEAQRSHKKCIYYFQKDHHNGEFKVTKGLR